jgi:hypothetical protein
VELEHRIRLADERLREANEDDVSGEAWMKAVFSAVLTALSVWCQASAAPDEEKERRDWGEWVDRHITCEKRCEPYEGDKGDCIDQCVARLEDERVRDVTRPEPPSQPRATTPDNS